MNQSSATRGHWLIAIGAIAVVGAAMLQWWQIGGGPGELPERSGIGISDGRVLLMFVAAMASLFLVTLPFASDRSISIDHPLTYTLLLAAMIIGYLLRLMDLFQHALLPWPPTHGLGVWLAVVGMAIYSRGIFEVYEERTSRLY